MDNSVSIYRINTQNLAIEMLKIRKEMLPEIVSYIFIRRTATRAVIEFILSILYTVEWKVSHILGQRYEMLSLKKQNKNLQQLQIKKFQIVY